MSAYFDTNPHIQARRSLNLRWWRDPEQNQNAEGRTMQHPYQVFVKCPWDGKTRNVYIDKDTTCVELKRQICGRGGPPMCLLRLYVGGAAVENGELLSQYGVDKESTLEGRIVGCRFRGDHRTHV